MHLDINRTFRKWDATEDFCGDKWNKELDVGYNGNKNGSYPYRVDVNVSLVHEQLRWCASNCEGRFHRYRKDKNKKLSILSVMAFEKEEDALIFKLRWI